MVNKTTFLHCRLDIETKKKLKQKADELGLDLTEFIKKIAEEEIVILDKNITRLFGAIGLEVKDKCVADSNTKFKYLGEQKIS